MKRPGRKSAMIMGMTPGLQFAALPWRQTDGLEVLLVTSRESRRWVIPKGWPMKGRKPHLAAAREALEEAGVAGRIAKRPVGSYGYLKRLKNGAPLECRVEVFPLKVQRQRKRWPEQHERTFRWFPAAEAAAAVDEPELQQLIGDFAQTLKADAMPIETQRAEEAVGDNFDIAMMLEARKRTRDAIATIAAGIAPGMVEEDAVAFAQRVLADAGMARGWHGVYVRFGANTLLNFGEPSAPGTVLRENDIFFIDIGPVWEKWEGDGGDTFVVGDDPVMRAAMRDARVLFDRVQNRWRKERLTGTALYDYAAAEAIAMGWTLNLNMAGHRLSDFPHRAIHRGPLAAAPYAPSAGLWVLEIQIRHPTLPISAFYEDLLLGGET